MDNLAQDRWTEIQFYYITADLLQLRNNMMDVMDIIDNFAMIGKYSPEPIKTIAQEVLSSIRYRPTREEFVLICHKFDVPVKEIKTRCGIHNRTLYELLAEDKENPRMFYPRLRPEQTEQIKAFVNTFNKIKGVGLT